MRITRFDRMKSRRNLKGRLPNILRARYLTEKTPLTSVRSCLFCHVLNVTSISLIVLVFALIRSFTCHLVILYLNAYIFRPL